MEVAAQASDDARRAALGARIGLLTSQKWRVESQTDYQAVLAKGHRTNHLLHLILSVLTLGLWLIVWLILALVNKEKRMVLTVDEAGEVRGA